MVSKRNIKPARRIVVQRVIDGDSLSVKYAGFWSFLRSPFEVRLYGIDAPEGKQPYGEESARYLLSIIKNARWLEEMDIDRYGRKVSVVYGPRGREDSVNHQMVRAGMAYFFPVYAKGEAGLAVAEAEAKSARKGIWSQSRELERPWDYRKGLRQRGKVGWVMWALLIGAALVLGGWLLSAVGAAGLPFSLRIPFF